MPLIYSDRMYALLFALLFGAWCISELLGPARWQGSKEAQKQDRGSTILLAVSTGIGVLFFFILPTFIELPITAIAQFAFFVGTIVIVLGSGLRWWAIRHLGKSFTGSVVVEESQKLVMNGPYCCIRHPAYTGILLVVLGFGLIMNNWASLLSITIGMSIGLLYRISVEEAALRQHFGEKYQAYMAGTKRLIPFLI